MLRPRLSRSSLKSKTQEKNCIGQMVSLHRFSFFQSYEKKNCKKRCSTQVRFSLFSRLQVFNCIIRRLRPSWSSLKSMSSGSFRQTPFAVGFCTALNPASQSFVRKIRTGPSHPLPRVLVHFLFIKKYGQEKPVRIFNGRGHGTRTRGACALLAFQASSLATRSTLYICGRQLTTV